jgi:prevent-host-death family protein
MKTVPAADVGADLDEYLDRVAEDPIIITRDGRPVAALVPVDEGDDLERLSLAHNRRFRRLLEEAYERVQRGGGLSEEQFWQTVEARYEEAGDTQDKPH